jgi:hypothetical protein
MGKSLLIGNGINRLNNHEISWENVLRSLWVENPDRRQLEYMKHKPFGLLYEEILLSRVSPTRPFDEPAIKRHIAAMVKELKCNDYHRRIVASGAQHILTTNYDYALENSTGLDFAKKNLQPESKYSLFRRRTAEDTFVWHIQESVMRRRALLSDMTNIAATSKSCELMQLLSVTTRKARLSKMDSLNSICPAVVRILGLMCFFAMTCISLVYL